MVTRTLATAHILFMTSSFGFALGKPNHPTAPTAPLPPEIATAKSVFLSNSCNDSYSICTGIYNQLYAGLQSQSKYMLVLDPAQANLVFEIHYSTKLSGVSGSSESGPISQYGSTLQIVILDRATHIALWSIAESGTRKVTAVDQFLSDLQTLSSSSVQSSSTGGDTTQPVTHKTRMTQESQ